MSRHSRHRRKSAHPLRLFTAAVMALGTLTGVLATSSHADGGITDVMALIPMPDGVSLSSETVTAAGNGPHPLIVMPGSWGSNQLQYHYIALLFANAGYDVVGYSDRGMNQSSGVSDYADTASVSDVSSVIDWAVAHLNADPNKVGAFAISYGGGVSLLAAERDPRIKAVASFSSWTDWGESFLPSGSISSDLIRALALSTTGSTPRVRLGPNISTLFDEYQSNPKAARALINKLAPSRSPVDDVAALNANHTAVMLANGLQDSLLSPHQLVTMFNKLTGPRRLELRTGDHGQPEAGALFGDDPQGPVTDALAWMDHYVRGVNNGADKAQPVQLTDTITGVTTGYPRWPAGKAVNQVNPLAAPATVSSNPAAIGIDDPADDSWSRAIPWGLNTYSETSYEQTDISDPYRIPTQLASNFSSYFSFVWNGATETRPLVLAGSPTATVYVEASKPPVTMVAYLWDVDASGVASFMTAAPLTIATVKSDVPRKSTFSFEPIAWTVQPGHHLTLVIDSADHRWLSTNVNPNTVMITSTATAPAQLTLPVS